jgi:D-3-phosphoglycerate dehydrogenase
MGLPSYSPSIDPESDGNFVSTAEHTIMLILATLGDFSHAYQSMKEGHWEKKFLIGHELAGKTVGILGFGRIGSLVARRLAPFKVRIVAFDNYVSKEKATEYNAELLPLDEFCKQSDIISIHIPKNKDTEGILGEHEFSLMKDGVFIINTARAAIMDESVLIESLKNRKVKRAALDVFHDEPSGLNWDLIKMENVIATPHIGGSTHEAWKRISLSTADNIISFFRGKTQNILNP